MDKFDYDTVVIGAGVAGLSAARILARNGITVVVLEARERVGGRVHSVGTVPVEVGAEFIHGLPQESWALVREAGLATFELHGAHLRFDADRLRAAQWDAGGAFSVLERMSAWIEMQPSGTDATFAEYLGVTSVDEQSAREARNYVEGFNAADANLIGVRSLNAQQRAEDAIEADRLFRVKLGYAEFPRAMAADVRLAGGTILLHQIVRRISWRRGLVEIEGVDAQGGEFRVRACRCLITLPLGVLHAGSVHIAPDPAAILTHARRLAMGAVTRVTLVFESKFWVESFGRFSFLFAPDNEPATWWTAEPDAAPTLTGWLGGPKALRFQQRVAERGGSDALVTESLSTLARIFSLSMQTLRDQLVSCHSHDWQHDEFSLGAYSYAPSGAIDASDKMTEPVEQTLFFAGEHTDISGHWGTVHGAIRSGIRAAAQIQAYGSKSTPRTS